MRISDWSSDVCSSDLPLLPGVHWLLPPGLASRPKPIRAAASKSGLVTLGSSSGLQIISGGMRHSADPIPATAEASMLQIGRASCRERVCLYVEIPVVAVSLKKKPNQPL